jgi:hypothetical protein
MSTVQVTRDRIRAEFAEMRGLRATTTQMPGLSERQTICQRTLDSLVAARFSSPRADADPRLTCGGSPATSEPSSARHEEWTILRTSFANGLIIGAPDLTDAAVARIDKGVRQPMTWWSADQAVEIPDFTTGTLVIRDVDRLDARQQECLARWMRVRCPRVQVLALARAPFFAQVEDGRFSAALYYCMNIVVVEVREPADLP